MSHQTCFYSVANNAYFPGLIGLINSVRANGHDDPFVVVDAGLTDEQRELLEEHAKITSAPVGLPPTMLKHAAMKSTPADVMIYVDADVLCVRNLDPLVEEAGQQRIVVFEDPLTAWEHTRADSPPTVYDAWKARLSLGRMVERRYANAGVMVLPRVLGCALLDELESAQPLIDPEETFAGNLGIARPTDPFYYADQDVLNALLANPQYESRTTTLSRELMSTPPYPHLLLGADGITCATERPTAGSPFFLHHVVQKPWLSRAGPSLYLELLVRAINRPQGPVHLRPEALPAFLQSGPRGDRARRRRARIAAIESRILGHTGIRRTLTERRGRRYRETRQRALREENVPQGVRDSAQ